jgi:parallel beta-helix repeat protein
MRSYVRLAPLFACALFVMPLASAHARTYYVSPKGKDTYSGSKEYPWRSLHKAAKTMVAGDTVLIADGTYDGGVRQSREGNPGEPITYRAINPGNVILRGDRTDEREVFTVMETHDIVVDGLTAIRGDRVGFWVATSDNVVIRNCRALDNGVTGIFTSFSNDLVLEYNECAGSKEQHGIYVSNSGDRPTVRYNVAYNNGRCGIQLNGDGKQQRPAYGAGGDGIIEGALIEGNVLYENGQGDGGAALNLLCVHNSLVSNNLLYNNEAGGISLFNDNVASAVEWGSKNNRIVNNTVYFKSGEGRWCLSFTNGSTGNVVANNILSGGHRGAYQFDNTSSFVADYNLIKPAKGVGVATNQDLQEYYELYEWRALTGNDIHSSTANPRFVSPSTAPFDYRLAAGSPAIGNGILDPDVRVDLLGARRLLHPNLGSFEGSFRPAAPVRLDADYSRREKKVTLKWTSPTSGCKYIVKRSNGLKGPFSVVARNQTKRTWIDKDVKSDRTYWYVVSAVSGGKEGDDSEPIKVVVP